MCDITSSNYCIERQATIRNMEDNNKKATI